VKVMDLNSRAVLRSLKGHTGPIHVTKFSSDNVHVISGSDDKCVHLCMPFLSRIVAVDVCVYLCS
jgi:U3 small nucleolar RNA-associated protein 15